MTFGDGMFETDLSQINQAVTAVPQNVTAQPISATEAMVSFTEQAPFPSSYTILASTSSNGGGNWQTVTNTTTVSIEPQPQGVGSIYLLTNSGGTGYTAAPFVTLTGGGGSGAMADITSTGLSHGSIVSITITNPGSGYTSDPTVVFMGGLSGTGTTATAMSVLTPNPVSHLMTGLSPNTEYYFAVEAGNNGTISNIVSGRTDSTALGANAVYEGFGYATGGISGQNGGTGWSSAWSAGTGAKVVNGNLTLAYNAIAPTSTGTNSLSIAGNSNTTAVRNMDLTVGVGGTVTWASFEEYNLVSTGLTFGGTNTGFGIGPASSIGNHTDNFNFYTTVGGTTTEYAAVNDEPNSSMGDNYFLATRMDFETSGTYVEVFLDPMPGMYPSAGSEMTWSSF